MTKVFYLLLFLSTSTQPTYYNKGMYFMTMEDSLDIDTFSDLEEAKRRLEKS